MSDKKQVFKAAQSTNNMPTVQEQTEALASQLLVIKDCVTPKAIEKVANVTGYSTKTVGRYLDGKIGILHRGEIIYSALLKEVNKKNKVIAA